jgi:hypothetical protein
MFFKFITFNTQYTYYYVLQVAAFRQSIIFWQVFKIHTVIFSSNFLPRRICLRLLKIRTILVNVC